MLTGLVAGSLLLAGCFPPPPPPPPPYPTPATTGFSRLWVALRPYTGPTVVTRSGTVIDGADITGGLEIRANNVTITRSRITDGGGATYVLVQDSGSSGLTVTDTEVTARPGQVADRAIASFGTNMVLTRVYVHGTQRGIQTGDGTVVRDSYSDDFNNQSGNHATGVMSLGGTNHVVLDHNTFGCGTGQCSSAMSVYPQNDYGGPNDDWTITNNHFNGGSYCVYLGYTPGDGERPNTNIRFINNSFGTKYHPRCGEYGPVASWGGGVGDVWSGNVWFAPFNPLHGTPVSPS